MNKKIRFITAVILTAAMILTFLPSVSVSMAVAAKVGGSGAQIVKTVYPTNDVVVADMIITPGKYDVDPAGIADSTKGIQKALDDCYNAGGGTVFLPVGKYRVTKTITIPAFVNLRGDWLDPDTVTTVKDYGTVILADVESSEKDLPALINLYDCGGTMGLTIYYPKQDIDNVKPFPYTFHASGNDRGGNYASVINCTIINGYKGVAASIQKHKDAVHTNFIVENVKGACLFRGIELYNAGDVDTYKLLTFDNKYWATAPAEYKPPERQKIDSYTRKNGIGMTLGDLEQDRFSGIYISDYKIGINIVKGPRHVFSGLLYDIYVKRCGIALQIDDMDTVIGVIIARGILEGEEYSILHNKRGGKINLTGIELKGKVSGLNIHEDTTVLGNEYEINYHRFPVKPPAVLHNVEKYGADETGKTDTSASIQRALDDAEKAGGGIVYLPAGYYRIDKPLNVGKNVQLRGCATLPTRDNSWLSIGTLILAYYGETSDPDNATALITLNGDNAGISGLRFVYPRNGSDKKAAIYKKYSYTIRGKAKGVYIINSSFMTSYNGIDFRNCDNHIIKNVIGQYYNNGFYVGGKNGLIENCLANDAVNIIHGLHEKFDEFKQDWITWQDREIYGDDPDVLNNTHMLKSFCFVKMDKTDKQIILNLFSFRARTLVSSINSTNTLMLNIGLDIVGDTMLEFKGGNSKIVNMMRIFGVSYNADGTQLTIYNRVSMKSPGVSESFEPTISPFVKPQPQNLKEISLKPLFGKHEILYGTEFTVDKNCFTSHVTKKDDPIILALKIPPTDITELSDANKAVYVEFNLYINDVKLFKNEKMFVLELTSSGECDKDEYQWVLFANDLKTGWNTVRYNMYESPYFGISGKPDLKKINFVRLYTVDCAPGLQLKFDNLKIVEYDKIADELIFPITAPK